MAPARDSLAHNIGTIRQVSSIPAAVEADKQIWEAEQRIAMSTAKKPRQPRPYPQSRRQKAEEEARTFPGHLSALALLPGYDKFGFTVFDPMHSLLEGACKTYFTKVIVFGDHGSGGEDAGVGSGSESDRQSEGTARDAWQEAESIVAEVRQGRVAPRTQAQISTLENMINTFRRNPRAARKRRMFPADILRLQELLRVVVTPSSVTRLHDQFGTASAGTPTANHWRVFSTVFGPLVIPQVFLERGRKSPGRGGNPHLSSAELEAMMTLFEIISVALRSSISDTQVDYLDGLIARWQKAVFALHDSLKRRQTFTSSPTSAMTSAVSGLFMDGGLFSSRG